MPVQAIADAINWPVWAGARYRHLDVLNRFLAGTFYAHLRYPFYQEEESAGGRYIPLRERRPSVIYNICRVVVNRSTRMVFGGQKFPKFVASDADATKFLQRLKDQSSLQNAMLEASFIGSLGSVGLFFAVRNGKFFYEIHNAKHCMPIFDEECELESCLIIYPVFGYDLKARGYKIEDEDLNVEWFYSKRYTKTEEIVYLPIKTSEFTGEKDLKTDPKSSETHGLGEVPGVWIKNLYPGDGVDGDCTFGQILELAVEMDYQLSQCGRGLKYNSDPQLLIKEPSGQPGADQLPLFGGLSQGMVRSAGNALIVGETGDAKLLEISGQGQKAVLEFVDRLHRYALEAVGASHKDPDRAYGNMSGRAMEILDEDLIATASALRLTWGENGLLRLLFKIMRAAKKLKLIDKDFTTQKDFSVELYWGNWFDPTPADLLATEQALDLAFQGRRLFDYEARSLSAGLWGVGSDDPAKAAARWPLPPEPPMKPIDQAKVEIAKTKAAAGPSGGNGRSNGRVLA